MPTLPPGDKTSSRDPIWLAAATGRSLPAPPAAGSRRRRLWELPGHAHCPVLGVCLPMPALRRLVGKVAGAVMPDGDYELHCSAVNACKQRGAVADALQRELDRRFLLTLRQAAKAKSEAALAVWWLEAGSGKDLGAALWAVLTHAHCTPALEDRVLAEVHMLQHQTGMATRVELARFEALIDENAVLSRELASAQHRCTRQATEFARRVDTLEAQGLRTRADLLARSTELDQAREQLATLQQAHPDLAERQALRQETLELGRRLTDVQRSLLQAEQAAERQRQRADELQARLDQAEHALRTLQDADAARVGDGSGSTLAWLAERSVLCVGGRSASVPVYRQVIERTGGRFLHHDGGEEDGPHKLDATLAAADLVICQTGCVSHDAYWRVKDHCKRTGKRCVFVETPSRAALERALATVTQAATETAKP